MSRCAKKPQASSWRAALDRLAHARSLSWADGAATEAAWEQVRQGESTLLADTPDLAALAEKLRYLLAVGQPSDAAALPLAEQPWRHRVLRAAIQDAAALGTALGEAQSECRRLRRAWTQAPPGGRSTVPVPDQVAALRAKLGESLAERDAALDALARWNQGLPQPGPAGSRPPPRLAVPGNANSR